MKELSFYDYLEEYVGATGISIAIYLLATAQYTFLIIFLWLFMVLLKIYKSIDLIRKLTTLNHLLHTEALIAIMNKLKITEEDIIRAKEEKKEKENRLSPQVREAIDNFYTDEAKFSNLFPRLFGF